MDLPHKVLNVKGWRGAGGRGGGLAMTRHFLKSLGKDSARRINQDLKASVRLVQVGQKNSRVQRELGLRGGCF